MYQGSAPSGAATTPTLSDAPKWYASLVEQISMHLNGASTPLFIGINGCQGSGKSTLCAFIKYHFEQKFGKRVVNLSLDDFYLSRSHRTALAVKVHPLLATRGVPGTHDTVLLAEVLQALKQQSATLLPRFEKANDDLSPSEQWLHHEGKADIVLLEGWCWGVPPQSDDALGIAVNELESHHDPLGVWRRYVNRQLKSAYVPLYPMMDKWLSLNAPSFDIVHRWRCEQEWHLKQQQPHTSQVMNDQQIHWFIQHFERLTRHALNCMPARSDWSVHLDATRHVTRIAGV